MPTSTASARTLTQAHDRKRLEPLCLCITRPALSDERVQGNATGQAELELKTTWRNGSTYLVMSPVDFIQRLAALLPGCGGTWSGLVSA